MLYLLCLSIFFAMICLGIFLLNLSKKENKQVKEPFIIHELSETKINIPEFTLPEITPKKLQDNNRDAQFTRSLERIIGKKQEIFVENEPVEELNITVDIDKNETYENSVPIVNHGGNSHGYYQQMLQSKEEEEEETEEKENITEEIGYEDIKDNLRRDKINILLMKASEISQDED